jgi:ParB/RepB/Spo0J family partition protein
MSIEAQVIKLTDIRVSPIQMRDAQTNSDEFAVLVKSIKKHGFKGTITVNPKTDDATEESFYEIVDGCQRFTAAKEAGLTEITCMVEEMDAFTQMATQFVMNKGVSTKPAQFGAQCIRMMTTFFDQNGRDMTMAELAEITCQSPAYCAQRLKIVNGIEAPEIKEAIDEGKITLINAIALSKLPVEEQVNNIADAMTMPTGEFCAQTEARVQEIKKAAREGRTTEAPKFVPKSKLRKSTELNTILDLNLSDITSIVEAADATEPADAFREGIRYALSLDAETLRVQEASWNQKQKEKERKATERKTKKDAETAAKKLAEAEALEETVAAGDAA